MLASACSDDDDNSINMAEEVAASYEGYTTAQFSYSPTPIITNGEKITITSNQDETINLVMTSEQWGTTTIPNTMVTTDTNGKYKLAGEGISLLGMHGGTPKEYACLLEGTISTDKTEAVLTFTLPAVMGGTTIVFSLGNAPANIYLSGSYAGYSSAVFPYSANPMITSDEKITISANEDETIKIVFVSSQWGTTTISNATIKTEIDGSFTLSGEGISLMAMAGSEAKEYACQLSGIITKDKSTSDLIFKLSIMGGTTITFHMGDAPTSEE